MEGTTTERDAHEASAQETAAIEAVGREVVWLPACPPQRGALQQGSLLGGRVAAEFARAEGGRRGSASGLRDAKGVEQQRAVAHHEEPEALQSGTVHVGDIDVNREGPALVGPDPDHPERADHRAERGEPTGSLKHR